MNELKVMFYPKIVTWSALYSNNKEKLNVPKLKPL